MRLIDADAFIRFLAEQKVKETGAFTKGVNKALNIAISALKNLQITPTVDAVPVVRCGKRKNWKPYGSKAARKIGDPLERYGGCEIWHGGHLESDFCSYGQRRDQSADVRNMGQVAGGGKTGGPNDADQH